MNRDESLPERKSKPEKVLLTSHPFKEGNQGRGTSVVGPNLSEPVTVHESKEGGAGEKVNQEVSS